jgi:hypothetical protein
MAESYDCLSRQSAGSPPPLSAAAAHSLPITRPRRLPVLPPSQASAGLYTWSAAAPAAGGAAPLGGSSGDVGVYTGEPGWSVGEVGV